VILWKQESDKMVSRNDETAAVPEDRKLRHNPILHILVALIGISLTILLCYSIGGLCFLSGVWYRSNQIPESLTVINQDDEMVVKMARRYNLAQAIERYDQVVNAIEKYQEDHGAYPPDLEALVPEYLSRVPDVYIRAGWWLEYSPDPEHEAGAPFTFYVYGHHTWTQFMHGWELKYCPEELDFCGELDDHLYHPHRINHQWIWVNRSANW
jgi:hypothetical protein